MRIPYFSLWKSQAERLIDYMQSAIEETCRQNWFVFEDTNSQKAPVLKQDYLNLRLVRLKASEQWGKEGDGLYFLFPRAGAGCFLNGTAKQALSTGDVLVLNGEGVAKISTAKGAEFAFWCFCLRMDHLFPLFAGTEISLLQALVDSLKGYRFYPASSPLAEECHKLVAEIPPQFNLDHRGQLLRLAAAILNEEFKNAQGKRVGFVRAEDHLVQVFEKLSADEILSLSVPELAERFGCSRRHLNRLFHHYFGYSVAALRMEMRLMKAVSLLRDCDAKVINVAEQCGFNHLGLFNTCFRRRFGASPGQWRKALTDEMVNPAQRTNGESECPLRITGLCPWNHGAVPQGCAPVEAGHVTKRAVGQNGGLKTETRDHSEVDLQITMAGAPKTGRSLAFQVRARP